MRTWSVIGTAFALCTRSSSLSMRTRTSMGWAILLLSAEWGATSSVGEELLQAACNRGRHEGGDVAAERGDLLDPARGDEAHLGARHHVDGLDLGRERPVQLVHLELVLEVRDHAKALHDHLRVPASREVDDELLEHVDLDVRDVGEGLADEVDALLDRQQGVLVLRIPDDADDDAV